MRDSDLEEISGIYYWLSPLQISLDTEGLALSLSMVESSVNQAVNRTEELDRQVSGEYMCVKALLCTRTVADPELPEGKGINVHVNFGHTHCYSCTPNNCAEN